MSQQTLTMADVQKLLAEERARWESESRKQSTQIKLNSSGGLFVRSPAFRCKSKDGKVYVGSFNMPLEVATTLFGKDADPTLVAAIGEFLSSTKS